MRRELTYSCGQGKRRTSRARRSRLIFPILHVNLFDMTTREVGLHEFAHLYCSSAVYVMSVECDTVVLDALLDPVLAKL